MPITLATNVVYTLTSINLDMVAMNMVCGFTRSINGVPDGSSTITIFGTALATLFATQASAGQALSDEITIAIYNYAVSNNLLTGVIS